MTQDHPITPPPELFRQWEGMPRSLAFEAAYRAGADQELEACCEWLQGNDPYGHYYHQLLRAARRPKPLSLAKQAMEAQQRVWNNGSTHADWEVIRRALERLQELENND